MSEFTPAPWRFGGFGGPKGKRFTSLFAVHADRDYGSRQTIISPQYKGREVEDIWLGVSESNAHLIAAAPDMYEALQNIMNGIDTGMIEIITVADEQLAFSMQQARKALAKARGET